VQNVTESNEPLKIRKFAREYLEKYPSVKKVYTAIAGNRRRGSVVTAEHYINYISFFVEYIGYSDPEVALADMRSGKVDPQKKIDEFIDYALDEMPSKWKNQDPKQKGRSHNTVRNYAFGVKKWFDQNDIKVNWDKIEMPTGTEIKEHDRAPTKEELRTLLKHCLNLRDQAVIYCDTSCGLRINTLLSLTFGDVDFSYPDVARFTVVRKAGRKFGNSRSGSSGSLFITWITPEAKQTLKTYLEERERSGETITPESPLFTDAFNKGSFITIDAYGKVWTRLLQRSGLAKKSTNWHELHIHTLRKYFRSNCIGVDASYREMWMGHKGQYLDISYFRAEEQRHLDEYRKIVQYLTIQEIKTDETKLRIMHMMDMAKIMGFSDDKIKRLEDTLQRAKNPDEAIEEFRKLKDEPSREFKKLTDDSSFQKPASQYSKLTRQQKYSVVKGENELVRRLDDGWNLVKSLSEDKYLLERF
jgi:integrase